MTEPETGNTVLSSSAAPPQDTGQQPQSSELVRNDNAPQSPVSIDSLSKVLAVALVFLYVSGFLITSLHNFQYGFSEMNPLRPRILAAGGWFAIFIAVPFTLVWELKKHSVLKDGSNNLSKFATLVAAYMASAIFLISGTQGLFAFDYTVSPVREAPFPWWLVILVVLGFLVALALVVFAVLLLRSKLPAWAASASILLFYGYIQWSAYYELFTKHSFRSNAMYFWILVAGGYIYYELNARTWTLRLGQWERTMVGVFILMTIFATVYYPRIMAKWGGGALIPIELTFSKDAPVRPDVQFDCSLIDETDAGFYVVGKGEPSATFIPRAEISSIYYGQGNGHSVLTESPPQQLPSSSPNIPTSNQPATPSRQPVSTTSRPNIVPQSTTHSAK
jgi:hypothetical protein